MKTVILEPGPKPNTIFVPLPDPIIQYLGWKEGDQISIEIHQAFRGVSEYLVFETVVSEGFIGEHSYSYGRWGSRGAVRSPLDAERGRCLP